MQSICHLSRRWHQQFCRSHSPFGHWQCLQQWQTRAYRKARPRLTKPNPNVTVREYEQIEGKPETRRLIEKNEDQKAAEMLRDRIKNIERELAIMREGPFSRNSEFMQQFPTDERERLLKAMEEADLGDEHFNLPEIDFSDLDLDEGLKLRKDDDLGVTLRIPAHERAYVRRFNAALKTTNTKTKRILWVWYLRCQQRVANFSSLIPEDVWDHLWKTQLDIHPRSKHIVMLGKDMEAAGVSLPKYAEQYIEALHYTGDTSTAIRIWEKEKLSAKVGAQLYATVGRPSKAEEIALLHPEPDTILPVIQAWAESKQSDAAYKLWLFYLKIKPTRDLLGQITSILLNAGRQEMALAVFKDMITGTARIPAAAEKDINQFGLTAVLTVPGSYKNKFFFGAWIRWLLATGKVHDATLVVELMTEMGVRPDARHLNGIIAAWLRQDSREGRTKAEQIAWAMVQERVRQVQYRGRDMAAEEDKLLKEFGVEHWLPPWLLRKMPAANAETFSILIQRYTRTTDRDKAADLTQIMKGPAQIKLNSFILNHWLHMSLRSSDLDGMWRQYQAAEAGPDMLTFMTLWDGQRRNLTRSPSSSFPDPRPLYLEMTNWLATLSGPKLAEAKGQFDASMYEQIIRCFCLHSDLPGTLLAVRHLHEIFNILPHEEVATMIIMQAARMMPSSLARGSRANRPARRGKDEMYRAALGNLTDLFNEIFLDFMVRFHDKGADINAIHERETPEARAMRLESIQSFICLVMQRYAKVKEQVGEQIAQCGRNIGVPVENATAKKWLKDAVDEFERGGGPDT